MMNFFPRWGRVLLLLALPFAAQAQNVGIGTTAPDVSAALDIVSSSKGVLLPRVAAATSIASPATGLLVFQTGGTPGFYYNAGTPGAPSWQQLATGSGAGDNLGNHTATQALNLGANALTGSGASISGVGVGVRADGGLNLGQNGGSLNVYLGYQAGAANTTGVLNTFTGYQAGAATTTGGYNLFAGTQAGLLNTGGTSNVFLGASSGRSTTSGGGNVFGGTNSGYGNTTGVRNTFLGAGTGYTGSSNDNVFVGFNSGYYNTTGNTNLFSGYQSGYSNTSGSYNLFSGFQSGFWNSTGSANTALGYNSGPAFFINNLTNTTALGANAAVATSNTIQLGDANITALRCQVGLTITSDARFKYDVRADVPGLTFISALRPVTYRFDQARLGQFERTGTLAARSAPDAAAPRHTGFLAQDVEAAAQALHFRFDGVHAPANARDHYGLGYAQFVVPLVQAVQELNAEVEALKAQNAALQQQQQTQTTRFDEQQASLQTLQQQLARLLGEAAPTTAQARK